LERGSSPRVPELSEIYETWFDDVSKWIRAMGGPEADRDDIVQDVFVTVYRRLPDFDGKNLPGWLYQIARHKVRDFRRLRWVRTFWRKSPLSESLPSATPAPEAALDAKQSEAILNRLIDKLPESQRACFVLFEIDGCSGEEIAKMQGVPLNTVWARIRKARMTLRSHAERLPQYRHRRAPS
jgi:RNA polymerase sigma-70 factor (ECF subfamily)